jgi:hypothetical protein
MTFIRWSQTYHTPYSNYPPNYEASRAWTEVLFGSFLSVLSIHSMDKHSKTTGFVADPDPLNLGVIGTPVYVGSGHCRNVFLT